MHLGKFVDAIVRIIRQKNRQPVKTTLVLLWWSSASEGGSQGVCHTLHARVPRREHWITAKQDVNESTGEFTGCWVNVRWWTGADLRAREGGKSRGWLVARPAWSPSRSRSACIYPPSADLLVHTWNSTRWWWYASLPHLSPIPTPKRERSVPAARRTKKSRLALTILHPFSPIKPFATRSVKKFLYEPAGRTYPWSARSRDFATVERQ